MKGTSLLPQNALLSHFPTSSLGAFDAAAISVGMASLCPDSAREAFVCARTQHRARLRERGSSAVFSLEPSENARSVLSLDLVGAARERPKSGADLLPLLDSSLTLRNYIAYSSIPEHLVVDPGLDVGFVHKREGRGPIAQLN